MLQSVRGGGLCGACLLIGACAGDGSGLDENGRPVAESAPTLEPTLASIQSNVFTPLCTTCHAGAAAPLGLRLDEGAAYAMLVNAPSVENPSLMRVTPGNPDASYLVQKVEGTAGVGGRMPLNGPPLSSEVIAVIRQWILDGAMADAAADATTSAKLEAVWPMSDASLPSPPSEIVLSASAELDVSLLGAGVITLRASGGDADFLDGDERDMALRVQLRSLNPTVFAATPGPTQWSADVYELRVSGGAPVALADLSARPVDGDRDGAPGGDFIMRFKVETTR